MIFGENIRLRAIEPADLDRFVEWFNDPEVTHHLMRFLPMSMQAEKDWYEKLQEQPEESRPLALDAREGDQWIHIGSCGLHDIDWRSRKAELGIAIGDKRYWDRGYGSDAVQTLLRHGFETLNFHRVYLYVFEDNERAIKVYLSQGFQEEGRLRDHSYRKGDYRDMIIMGILRREWKETEEGKD
ncbi:MAG TPA: GNAT family N-acetyltransferase [Anaerolineae bacterium]|nr:GNAT family N-acetyltransferase [Anaerolineae bacterium]